MGDLAAWRDVSIILLSLEAFIIALPFVILGYYVVRGLRLARRWLKEQFPIWQSKMVEFHYIIDRSAGKAVAPIVAIASFFAAVQAVLYAFVYGFKRN